MKDKLKKINAGFWIIFIIGVLIRATGWPGIPGGLNQDEASIGYEAWSLLHYGIDRNGISYPVHFISWGSGQNALYAYLSMPFIALFGLTAFSIRIVNLLFGIAALPAVYYLTNKLFGSRAALIAMALCAIAPWHIMLSRWGLEGNIFPNIFLLGTCAYVKSLESKWWLPASAAIFALAYYSYGPSYPTVTIFFAGLLIYSLYLMLKKKTYTLPVLISAVAAFTIISIPIGLFVLTNMFNWGDISIGMFTVPELTGTVRFSAITGEASPAAALSSFWKLLVFQNDGLIYNALPNFGVVYIITLPFFIIGLFYIFSQKKLKDNPPAVFIPAGWLLLALSLLFIYNTPNINQVNILYLPVIIISAAGIDNLIKSGRQMIAVCVCYLLFFSGFIHSYFIEYKDTLAYWFNDSFPEAVSFAHTYADEHDILYITPEANGAYVYTLMETRTSPVEYVNTVHIENKNVMFQRVLSFGRYVFNTNTLNDMQPGIYVVSNRAAAGYEAYLAAEFKYYSVLDLRR